MRGPPSTASRRCGSCADARTGRCSRAADALPARAAGPRSSASSPDVVYVQDLWFFARAELDATARGRARSSSARSQRAARARHRCAASTSSSPPSRTTSSAFDRSGSTASTSRSLSTSASSSARRPTHVDASASVFVGGAQPERAPGAGARSSSGCASGCRSRSGATAPRLPRDSPIRRAYRGEAWGLDMYRVLARADRAQPAHRRRRGLREQHAPLRGDRHWRALVTEAAPTSRDCSSPGARSSPTRTDDELVDAGRAPARTTRTSARRSPPPARRGRSASTPTAGGSASWRRCSRRACADDAIASSARSSTRTTCRGARAAPLRCERRCPDVPAPRLLLRRRGERVLDAAGAARTSTAVPLAELEALDRELLAMKPTGRRSSTAGRRRRRCRSTSSRRGRRSRRSRTSTPT